MIALPGRFFSLREKAANEVTIRLRVVPHTVLAIEILYALMMLPFLKTSL
jgi:hypothetical protein